MTPAEYQLQVEAYELRQLDKSRGHYEIAWATMKSQQTTASGKDLKYNTFEKLYGNKAKKIMKKIKSRYNPAVVQSDVDDTNQEDMSLLDKLERRLNG
ncbi:hypothetical protein R53653_IHELHDKM_01567 [Fructobacillus cardui]|nr:hypothetical protein R53653_IHELHDKM_01567 [Fructobacillus cardui]